MVKRKCLCFQCGLVCKDSVRIGDVLCVKCRSEHAYLPGE